jgi:hypothetical protein
MTEETNWIDKKNWILVYRQYKGPETMDYNFYTREEAMATFRDVDMGGRDIAVLIDLVGREVQTLVHPLDADVIDFPEQEPQF